jgi:hypothetical protein
MTVAARRVLVGKPSPSPSVAAMMLSLAGRSKEEGARCLHTESGRLWVLEDPIRLLPAQLLVASTAMCDRASPGQASRSQSQLR